MQVGFWDAFRLADERVMDSTSGGTDHNTFGAPDFEFEHDWQLI